MIIGYFKSKKDKFIQKNIFKLIQHDYLFLFCLCLSQKLRRFLFYFVFWGFFFGFFWGVEGVGSLFGFSRFICYIMTFILVNIWIEYKSKKNQQF